jgi:hypothetical protein
MQKYLAAFVFNATNARTKLTNTIEESNNQVIVLIHNSRIKAYIVLFETYEGMIEKLNSIDLVA